MKYPTPNFQAQPRLKPAVQKATLIAATLIAATTLGTGGAAASPPSVTVEAGHKYTIGDRIDRRPLLVYVGFNGSQRGRPDERVEERLRHEVSRRLHDPVRFVSDRRQADIVVGARELHFDMNFQVTDIDRKKKGYHGRRKYGRDQCSTLYKAHYDRIKERGTATYDYALKVRVGDNIRYIDRFDGRASESFQYGRNLRAHTGCGIRPVAVFPSEKVARLFEQASPGYRHSVRREIRHEALGELASKMARIINRAADDVRSSRAYNDRSHDGRRYDRRHG